MNQGNTASPTGPRLLTFLAGATVGGLLVALTTPKTGPELRGDLKNLARRAQRKAGDLAEEADEAWADMKDCTALAAGDLERGTSDGG